jgi:iron-sulfur cluster repair protein YtfE (RIC family)
MEASEFSSHDRSSEPISLVAALQAGKKVAPDATDLLMQDHRQVKEWFRRYRTLDAAAAKRLLEQICIHLLAHMNCEEAVLYPEARQLVDEERLVDHSVEEHDEAKTIIRRLQSGELSAEEHQALVAGLESAILRHVEEEEAVLFPQIRASGSDLYAMGRGLAAVRAEVMSGLTGKPLPEATT